MASQALTTPFLVAPRGPAIPGDRTGAAGRHGSETPRGSSLWALVQAAYRRHRSRMVLSRLDADQLKDIGIGWAEAEYEANKPFWRR